MSYMYTEERFVKLVKEVENKLRKIGVITSDFDNITPEQEHELELIGKKITKVIGLVWDETNYQTARDLWAMEIKNSDLHDVIQYLE